MTSHHKFINSWFLDGSETFDPEEDLFYFWEVISQPDGGNAIDISDDPDTEFATFKVEKDGEYIFELVVTDGIDFSLPDTVKVTVTGDLILVSAEPIQAVEGVSALVTDKHTVFKAVIENTFPEDKTVFIQMDLDGSLVAVEDVLVKAGCKATYYFPETTAPTECDDKPLPAKNSFLAEIRDGDRSFITELDPLDNIDESDESNNKLTEINRWTITRDLVILSVPIRPFFSDMITPCPAEERGFAGVRCKPDPNRILTPIQWVDLVYPVDNIKYIQLPPYYNPNPRMGDNIPGLWKDVKLMRDNWIMSNPGTGREVVLYGWLPTNTLNQGWGWEVTKTGFGDENFRSIGNCANCGDMHINDILLAHEVGHMLKIKHPTDEKKTPSCTGFNAPFTSITINEPGYHIPTGHIKKPTINEHMMGGHCTALGVTMAEEKWTSPEGWDSIITQFGGTLPSSASTPSAAVFEDTRIVSGIISDNGNSGKLDPIYKSMFTLAPTGGPFTLEILDSGNNVLATQNFETSQPEHAVPGPDAEDLSFFLTSPFPAGTSEIRILNGAIVLDAISVTSNVPQVTVLFPNGGESLSGFQTITWDASDADGDTLFYKVEYSFDNGNTWNLIAKDITTKSQNIDFDQFPGNGNTALVRVTATDGINSNSDESDEPFNVSNKPPNVFIFNPETNIEISSSEVILLQGEAADIEDGVPLPDSSFSWTSSNPGELGTGRFLNIDSLSPGVHEISLSVPDSDGNVGTDTVTVFVDTKPSQPVGGELIPIDYTMVLVAGTQSTAAWMIPVIVSGIGFAIVIARKF